MTYFAPPTSAPSQCPGCEKWHVVSNPQVSCCVLHPPGSCCHHGETEVAPSSPSSAVPKSLTDNDLANLEKIAALRGYAGKLRAALLELQELGPHEFGCGSVAYSDAGFSYPCDCTVKSILSRALETPVPEDGT